jgi:hypothetical protein
VRLKAVTKWKTRHGTVRRIKLFEMYRNVLGRCRGVKRDGTGWPRWAGLECEFLTWQEFRAFALKNGYSKTNNSIDRIDPSRGYTYDNVRFIPQRENSSRRRDPVMKAPPPIEEDPWFQEE